MSAELCQISYGRPAYVIFCHKSEFFGGYMIMIDKNEAEYLRDRFPDLTITRTMKQKSKRQRYT